MRMKNTVIVSCILILSMLPLIGYGEEFQLHLLWDIPFGCSASDVSTYVSLNKGIICSRTTHAPTALTPQYDSIDSENDTELFLYGIPFHFSYSEYPGRFALRFQISGDCTDFDNAANALLSELSEMYGEPDVAYESICYNDQQDSREWSVLSTDKILPFSHFSNAATDGQDSVSVDVYIRFLNVIFDAKFDPENGSSILIYYNSDTQDSFGLPGSDTL